MFLESLPQDNVYSGLLKRFLDFNVSSIMITWLIRISSGPGYPLLEEFKYIYKDIRTIFHTESNEPARIPKVHVDF